jgi:four helix bundle protein
MRFDFEKLKVYQKSVNLAKQIQALSVELPQAQRIVGDQLMRAVLSIPANIAEGSAYSRRQFSHYLDIAKGSARECIPCMELLKANGGIDQEQFDYAVGELSEISKMLSGLKKSLNE